jgi:signal transduction histidine kinase/ActR/RegA family two-component response regulator
MTSNKRRGDRVGRTDAPPAPWELRLYVAGLTPKSLTAFRNLEQVCEEHLAGRYRIEVVDLHDEPAAAVVDQVVAVPTVVRKKPAPPRRVIGDLSNVERVLLGLEIDPRHQDATERRRAEQALRNSEARLIEANRAKDDFLATLSHELRTPMTAVLGWAQMLTTRNLDVATPERGLRSILRNAQAQTQLVTDILDVSRIVSGRLRLNIRPVDLVAVVYAALDSIRPAADAKRIVLTTSITAESTIVPGDADRLQQVVWDLLSNAVRFTPPGGRIEVVLDRTASHFTIRVRDNGAGIAPELLPRIFDRFVQADTSARRQHGGLGLGLSIVRNLVELHGGNVEAKSDGEGTGATFNVYLPIRAVRQPRHDEPVAPAAVCDAAEAAPGSLTGVRVLVVDDEADARDLVATVLAEYGADAVGAASASEGLERLERGRFDAVLADIGMPGQDGYDFIAAVRRRPPDAGGSIPAAALTAYGRPEDAERALAAGFHVHLTKPVLPAHLIATVAKLVRGPQPAA